MQGQTSPGAEVANVQRDGEQRLFAFAEDEWRVSLTYRAPGDRQPSRLDAQAGGAAIRLAIDSFRPGVR
jgi:hypothetical protein